MAPRLASSEPTFTLGIEEEYHLVDRQTRDLVTAQPKGFLAELEAAVGKQVSPEFLRSQIEVGSRVCTSMAEVRADIARLRAGVATVAARHGMAPIAASTHPFARWSAQVPTAKQRYKVLAHDLAGVGRRLVISGMHVHVGIEDDELRIDLMNQVRYFLPHLLVLTTSSPFWQGRNTGLKCYRLAIYDELPRTGLPGRFNGWGEYTGTIDVLVKNGIIEDAGKIWWDVRPSARFPTLEMRIADLCTRLEDAIAVAALYRCVLRMLWRLRRDNRSWRQYPLFLLNENRWRAQRYGTDGSLLDLGKGALVPFKDLLGELIEVVAEDAAAFGCEAEVAHARVIAGRGTSADAQVAAFETARKAGASEEEALNAVVDWLIEATVADTGQPARKGPGRKR